MIMIYFFNDSTYLVLKKNISMQIIFVDGIKEMEDIRDFTLFLHTHLEGERERERNV